MQVSDKCRGKTASHTCLLDLQLLGTLGHQEQARNRRPDEVLSWEATCWPDSNRTAWAASLPSPPSGQGALGGPR